MADGTIRDIVERSIDELPDDLRGVFVACVINDITPEHYAWLFALNTETVEARLNQARSLLVDLLMGQISSNIGSVYRLDDRRSEHIASAVLDRLFSHR